MMNQVGGFFASDDEYGNTDEPLGWLYNYGNPWYGFPLGDWLYDDEAGMLHARAVDPKARGSDDNDGCDCDRNGDLSRIFQWTYGAAFNASKFVLDLYRKTVDRVPPTSTCFIVVGDNPVSPETWHRGEVRVFMPRDGVVDNPNTPGFRPSGVWELWGLVDGEWADQSDESGLSWTIESEGDPPRPAHEHRPHGQRRAEGSHLQARLHQTLAPGARHEADLSISASTRDLTDLLGGLRPRYRAWRAPWPRSTANPISNGQIVDLRSPRRRRSHPVRARRRPGRATRPRWNTLSSSATGPVAATAVLKHRRGL